MRASFDEMHQRVDPTLFDLNARLGKIAELHPKAAQKLIRQELL